MGVTPLWDPLEHPLHPPWRSSPLAYKSFFCLYLYELTVSFEKWMSFHTVTSATWPNKMSLTHPLSSNLASTHGQKWLSGSCGIQHYTPGDPGGVLSTHVLGNRPTHLGHSCGPWSSFRPALAPLGYSLRASGEHCLRIVTHGWESLCGSPDFQLRSFSTPLEQKQLWVWTHLRG